MEEEYKVSDTQLTATWEKIVSMGTRYRCTNCGKILELDHSVDLGAFCPRCGFRMTNPGFIVEKEDYGF